MDKLVDAHCHIYSITGITSHYNSFRGKDLTKLGSIKKNYVSIGYHPDYINEIDWSKVSHLLSSNPRLNIGEVGLDKYSKDRDKQVEVLVKFLDFANKFKRSVTVHCVKSWGRLIVALDVLERNRPLLLHSYSGSLDTTKQLLNHYCFFSFSKKDLKRDKVKDVVKIIPLNRLLIETDLLESDYRLIGSGEYYNRVESTYKLLSNIIGIDYQELVNTIYSNFLSFIKLGEV